VEWWWEGTDAEARVKIFFNCYLGEEIGKEWNNPEDESAGTREIPLVWVVYRAGDFMEVLPKNGFACTRTNGYAKSAYIIKCGWGDKDDKGSITELRCLYSWKQKRHDTSVFMWRVLCIGECEAFDTCEVRLLTVCLSRKSSSEEGDFKDYIQSWFFAGRYNRLMLTFTRQS